MSLTDHELRKYATDLMVSHARNIEYITVVNLLQDFTDHREISEYEANKILELIDDADITVSWPMTGAELFAELQAKAVPPGDPIPAELLFPDQTKRDNAANSGNEVD